MLLKSCAFFGIVVNCNYSSSEQCGGFCNLTPSCSCSWSSTTPFTPLYGNSPNDEKIQSNKWSEYDNASTIGPNLTLKRQFTLTPYFLSKISKNITIARRTVRGSLWLYVIEFSRNSVFCINNTATRSMLLVGFYYPLPTPFLGFMRLLPCPFSLWDLLSLTKSNYLP